ncbi:MAG: citrate lyase holo-[acyl-carrier protein] synthase [Veillonellales bacterium]
MKAIDQGTCQTLDDILKARDERAALQKRLLQQYKTTLISFKLNIPGEIKFNYLIKRIFDEGLQALRSELGKRKQVLLFEEVQYKDSGPEFFGTLAATAAATKQITLDIEENHPLGRLYDFDIIDKTGKQCSRQAMQRNERRCFLCDQPAFACARSRAHSIEAMKNKIQAMCDEYFGIDESALRK